MITPRFLQVHTLHSYPAALVDPDDSGLVKRLSFGDSARTLISSERLERSWRMSQDKFSIHNVPGGLVDALFGQEIAADPIANVGGAILVADSFTVHGEESVIDYFPAADDLQIEDEETRATRFAVAELTSGLFYGYAVLDVPVLVSNVEGCEADEWGGADRELAGKIVEHLLHLIATVSPAARRSFTAPYACADLVLLEAGSHQPRTLANAFRGAVQGQYSAAAAALSAHLDKLDQTNGAHEVRRATWIGDCDLPGIEWLNLHDLAKWASDTIRDGEV